MSMDRRDFLKMLGLGGVALTMPRPLSVIAAKMEDLERPPLHVGYVETMPAKPCGEGGFYLLYEMGVRVERGITVSRYTDYADKWTVSMFLRKQGDRTRGVQYFKTRASMMPNPENKRTAYDEEGKPHQVPHFYTSPKAMMLKPDDVIEFWFAPGDSRDPEGMPRYPLPKLEVVLRGVRHYPQLKIPVPKTGNEYVIGHPFKTRAIVYWQMCEVKKVLLDRAKAIELGLVTERSHSFYDFTNESR